VSPSGLVVESLVKLRSQRTNLLGYYQAYFHCLLLGGKTICRPTTRYGLSLPVCSVLHDTFDNLKHCIATCIFYAEFRANVPSTTKPLKSNFLVACAWFGLPFLSLKSDRRRGVSTVSASQRLEDTLSLSALLYSSDRVPHKCQNIGLLFDGFTDRLA
jgi:hypothetical protein